MEQIFIPRIRILFNWNDLQNKRLTPSLQWQIVFRG